MPPSSTTSGIDPDRPKTDPGRARLRRRALIALVILLPALAAVEVLVRRWTSPKASLVIANEGTGRIEGLVVRYNGSRFAVGTLDRGQSVRLRMTAGPPGPLSLDFRQKDNPNPSLTIPDYEPRQHLADGSKFVVVLKGGLLQRYVEEDDDPGNPEAPWTWLKEWFWSHFPESPP